MSGPIYAFFDFDGTLIPFDSIGRWLRFYYRRRPGRLLFLIPDALGILLLGLRLISSHTLKRIFLWPMSFEKPDALGSLAASFVREEIALHLRTPVMEKLREHHAQGHRVVVISASGIFYLKHLRNLLPPDCLILGTELEWNSGFLKFPAYRDGNLRGENKIHRLKEIGLGNAGVGGYAYSDHEHDIPLLRFVEHPVCVGPTRTLRKLANEMGWPIWEF